MLLALAGVLGAGASFAAEALPVGEPAPLPPHRPDHLGETTASPVAPAAPAATPVVDGDACIARLQATGAKTESVASPAAPLDGCGVAQAVRLISVKTGQGEVIFPDRPILECRFAAVFAEYVTTLLQPVSVGALGSPVASLSTGPGFECRGRNRVVGAKVSAHGKGLALDMMTVDFADKRRVTVERQATQQEQAWFHTIRTAACGWFTTVLGPGADASHVNNLHLDIEKHGSSASARICE